jgi:hypothetical protein
MLNILSETDSEIISLRKHCVELALRMPANQKEITTSMGGQQLVSISKTAELILADADKIYDWLIKDLK